MQNSYGLYKRVWGGLLSLVYPHIHISVTVIFPRQPAFSSDMQLKFTIFHAEEANELFELFTTDTGWISWEVEGKYKEI